jgi:pimeloyl-ACP methyl ester carboxylesterase
MRYTVLNTNNCRTEAMAVLRGCDAGAGVAALLDSRHGVLHYEGLTAVHAAGPDWLAACTAGVERLAAEGDPQAQRMAERVLQLSSIPPEARCGTAGGAPQS